jgi:hypothetical protein
MNGEQVLAYLSDEKVDEFFPDVAEVFGLPHYDKPHYRRFCVELSEELGNPNLAHRKTKPVIYADTDEEVFAVKAALSIDVHEQGCLMYPTN